jgi:tRNA(adenine34) deaminase
MNFLYEDTARFYIKAVEDALLDRSYPRQYHSPSRFGAPGTLRYTVDVHDGCTRWMHDGCRMGKRKSVNGETNGEPSAGLLRNSDASDEFFMGFALNEARAARDAGEVPIGAVVVIDNQIVGSGHNLPIGSNDPTAHAEVVAMREAALRMGNYRLTEATLYVTIEPCAMCAGALVNARVKRLVYGVADLRAGGVSTVFQICTNSSLNHQVEVISGVRAEEGRQLMQDFFRRRRKAGSEGEKITSDE